MISTDEGQKMQVHYLPKQKILHGEAREILRRLLKDFDTQTIASILKHLEDLSILELR